MSEANITTQDQELLTMAAKAAGYKGISIPYGSDQIHANMPSRTFHTGQCEYLTSWGFKKWNPLTDDGDALRLAVKLGILSHPLLQHYFAVETLMPEKDPYAATRRAIVRAAAEIGKTI